MVTGRPDTGTARSRTAISHSVRVSVTSSHSTWATAPYRAPRVTAELKDAGIDVNHNRVERVMRAGSASRECTCARRFALPVPEPSATPVPDLLQRDFTASEPNTRYVGDITYLPIGDGQFRYLATVLDLCSTRLPGWPITDHMRTELVTDALKAAARTRGRTLNGAVFHSDNGARYASQSSRKSATNSA